MDACFTERFNDFDVYQTNNKVILVHIKASQVEFYKGFASYFLDESRLLRYAEKKSNLNFTPIKRNYLQC